MYISEAMQKTPIQKFEEICGDCEIMRKALSSTENITPGEARATCSNCRKIYKFDALFRVLKRQEPFGGKRNKGKKSKITIHEKQVINSLHEDGLSSRQIAEKLGYSKSTVAKIVRDTKSKIDK